MVLSASVVIVLIAVVSMSLDAVLAVLPPFPEGISSARISLIRSTIGGISGTIASIPFILLLHLIKVKIYDKEIEEAKRQALEEAARGHT